MRSVNLVEFVAESEHELNERLAEVEQALGKVRRDGSRRGHTVARGRAEAGKIWTMRKRAAALLGKVEGERRSIPFVEDTAVPPERLADYIGEFRALLDRRRLTYGMFGHVDAGVLHVRPAIDMKDPIQEKLIRDITDEVAALTLKYGGLLWGEHGKGLRSEYGPTFFGPLYPALQKIKAAFDPHNQLNPGKIATPFTGALLTLDGVRTRGQLDRQIAPAIRASFSDAMHCNGNGACFNFDADDAMCPSWKATRDRRHSPKGRAALIREWLRLLAAEGGDPAEGRRWAAWPMRVWNSIRAARGQPDFSHEVKLAMDGCLCCKSCVGQCPVKVDVPGFRSKFLAAYHGRYLRPPKDFALAHLERMLPLVARVPALYNGFVSSETGKGVLRRLGLVATPQLSGLRPERVLAARGVQIATAEALRALSPEHLGRTIILVQDAFTSYFETVLLVDFVRLAQGLGFSVFLAPFRPNGKPLHVTGQLVAFAACAASNARLLRDISMSGARLVGIDPSMTLTYRSEYRQLLGKDTPEVLLPQEWLREAVPEGGGSVPLDRGAFYLLPHCTERTNAQAAVEGWKTIFSLFGARLEILPSGCCGMAGTYGHEAANRAISEQIYTMSWGARVREFQHSGRLSATGYSCRSQAKLIDGAALLHPIQILANLVDGGEHDGRTYRGAGM